jgi:DNA-binding NarL/FixJ family response regulator
MIRILICDDQEIIREGVKNILEARVENCQVMAARNGKEASELISKFDFDVVILDIGLPDISGINVLKQIKELKPQTKVIMLSIHSEKQYICRAFQLKASGYLTKDVVLSELQMALKKVMDGEKYLSTTAMNVLAESGISIDDKPKKEKLSGREKEILPLLLKGLPNREIADKLFMTSKVVGTYKSRIIKKYHFTSFAKMLIYFENNKPGGETP